MFQTCVLSFCLLSHNDHINVIMSGQSQNEMFLKDVVLFQQNEMSPLSILVSHLVLKPGKDLQWTTLANKSKSIL